MKTNWQQRNVLFAAGMAAAFLMGLWLRAYLLADQVLIDDEWHGFYYVIGKSPGWLLTHFSIPGATCIPLNVFAWAAGASFGWSELALRLPSVICGIVCVVVCPWLAKDLIGTRRAVLLGLLLAISPLLIFYSRIARPYSAVALLGFVTVLAAIRWMRKGDRISATLFVIAGALAVYFHLFAVITVATPILAALAYHAWLWRTKSAIRNSHAPTLRQWILAASIMAGTVALLVLPALISSMRTTFFNVALTGTFQWRALPFAAQLMSGTGLPVLAWLFWAAVIAGAVEQCRRNPWAGWVLVSLFPLHVLAFILSRPDSAQSAIVLARYCITLVPVSLLFAACGIQAGIEALGLRTGLRRASQMTLCVASVAALAFAGPLPQCYVWPNNFTSHGAYQHRYGDIDWRRSFFSDMTPADFPIITTLRVDEVNPFYGVIAEQPNARPIVEYPMLIGDHFNPLYYYQHFHQRPVLVGYTTNMVLPRGLAAGNIYGNTYIDQVMTVAGNRPRPQFRNMLCMDDVEGMRRRAVEYIILHKRFEAQLPAVAPTPPDLQRLRQSYESQLGDAVFEDAFIVVFRF